jgi:hypothetical protein
MLDQFLRLAGIGAFFLTGLVIAAGLVVVAVAAFTGRPRLLTAAAAGTAAWLVCYALAILAGPALTRPRTLGLGEELSFCGLDCHLHLAVTDVRRDGDVTVRLRFRSDAKAAAEYPSHLRVRVLDAAGRQYAAEPAVDLEPLAAGAEYARDLHFRIPAGATAERLVATWGDWPDYVVPGPENALVQRRRSILLTATAARPS